MLQSNKSKMLYEDNMNENESEDYLFLWFLTSLRREKQEICRLWNIKKSYLEIIKNNEKTNDIRDFAEKKFREYHSEQLRLITEHYHKICVYLPVVFYLSTRKRWNKFTVLLYEDIQRLYKKLYEYDLDKLLRPKTNDEKRILQILLEEFRNTEDILIPRLPKKYTKKHVVKCVTEEPHKIMKSKNHVLFVYEDEELNDKINYTLEEPIKVMKSKNHILFIYNE